MEQLIQEWRASLPKFREMTEKFYAKEVSVKEYKGFSGGYGSYAQKAILAFVDPVIVLSAKHLHGKQGLCLPEGLPQRELVLGVAFKIGGKASALNGAPGAFRHLRQLSPFRQGLRIGRMEPAGKGHSNIQNGQSPEKSIFTHNKCSMKVKVFYLQSADRPFNGAGQKIFTCPLHIRPLFFTQFSTFSPAYFW